MSSSTYRGARIRYQRTHPGSSFIPSSPDYYFLFYIGYTYTNSYVHFCTVCLIVNVCRHSLNVYCVVLQIYWHIVEYSTTITFEDFQLPSYIYYNNLYSL